MKLSLSWFKILTPLPKNYFLFKLGVHPNTSLLWIKANFLFSLSSSLFLLSSIDHLLIQLSYYYPSIYVSNNFAVYPTWHLGIISLCLTLLHLSLPFSFSFSLCHISISLSILQAGLVFAALSSSTRLPILWIVFFSPNSMLHRPFHTEHLSLLCVSTALSGCTVVYLLKHWCLFPVLSVSSNVGELYLFLPIGLRQTQSWKTELLLCRGAVCPNGKQEETCIHHTCWNLLQQVTTQRKALPETLM